MDGVPGLTSSVSELATMGMTQGDFTFELSCREERRKWKLHSGVNL